MGQDNPKTIRTSRGARASGRASEAWALRVAGLAWEDIAREVGYANGPNALRAVRAYAGTLPTPTREELRQLSRARAERLFEQAFRDVLQQRPGAVRSAVSVLQRQAALDGLDAPQRVEIDFNQPETQAALYAWLGTTPAEIVQEADVVQIYETPELEG